MDRKIDRYILTVHEQVYVHVEDCLGDGQEGEQIDRQIDRQTDRYIDIKIDRYQIDRYIYSNRP